MILSHVCPQPTGIAGMVGDIKRWLGYSTMQEPNWAPARQHLHVLNWCYRRLRSLWRCRACCSSVDMMWRK